MKPNKIQIDEMVTLLEEGDGVSLSEMITEFMGTEVPQDVYESQNQQKKFGTLVYLELYENNNSNHILKGGISRGM